MFSILCLVASVVVATAQGKGQEVPQIERPWPPQFGQAKVAAGGNVQIMYYVNKPVWETRTKEHAYTVDIIKDGKIVPEQRVRTTTYKVKKYAVEQRLITAKPEDFRVFRDNKPVKSADLSRHWTPVVFTDACKVLDDFYLRFLRKGVLVVYLRTDRTEPESPHSPTAPELSLPASAPTHNAVQ